MGSEQSTKYDALMVTVRADDLRAVLATADYMNSRHLLGPVDRMSDALALVTMRADLDAAGEQSAESDAHCILCGLRLSTASEWCMETRDGDHRPTLPTSVIPPGQETP